MKRFVLPLISVVILSIECAFAASFAPQTIYDDDDRYELSEASPEIQVLGRSVAGRVAYEQLEYVQVNGVPKIRIHTSKDGDWDVFCDDVPFRGQLIAPSCTGFLVDEGVLVTAGHCVNDTRACEKYVWVFGIEDRFTDASKNYIDLDPSQVAPCEQVVSMEVDSEGMDHAIVLLNGDAKRPGLQLRKGHQKIAGDARIFTIGHPRGIPLKVADNATVKSNSHTLFFTADLDTFAGNSGSPVFNKDTLEVEGVLVRGSKDFFWDYERGCFAPTVCRSDERNCSYFETVVRIREIPNLKY